MIKKLFCTLFIAASACLQAEIPTQLPEFVPQEPINLPTEFFVSQHWFSLTKTFDIATPEYKLGTVHRKFLTWMPTYIFSNIHENVCSKATMRFLTFGAVFDVVNGAGQPLGTVEEYVLTFLPKFDLVAPDGRILGQAKMNFWGTTYTLRDPIDDHTIAILQRAFFRLKDDWSIQIIDPQAFYNNRIDPALFIVLAAFQSDMDDWNAIVASSSSSHSYSPMIRVPKGHAAEQMFSPIRSQMAAVFPSFDAHDVTKADFAAAELAADDFLESFNVGDTDQSQAFAVEQMLDTLLNGDTLTKNQKKALAALVDLRLKALQK